jgi:hypothetical protein
LVIGIANLIYASYSCTLACRARRPLRLIKLLVGANLAWAVVCLGVAAVLRGQASVFGLAHLVVEAGFVGGLAVAEWRNRFQLAGH